MKTLKPRAVRTIQAKRPARIVRPRHVEQSDERRVDVYWTKRWRKLRVRFMDAFPTCQWSGCRQPAKILDHVIPTHALPEAEYFTPGNLGCLCQHHHNRKTNEHDTPSGLPQNYPGYPLEYRSTADLEKLHQLIATGYFTDRRYEQTADEFYC